jgi:hypothetical protein
VLRPELGGRAAEVREGRAGANARRRRRRRRRRRVGARARALSAPHAPPFTFPHDQQTKLNQTNRLGGGPPPTERDRAAQQRAAEQAEARQRAFESSAVGRAAVRAVKEAKEGAKGAGGGGGGSRGVGGSGATNSGPTAQDWLN